MAESSNCSFWGPRITKDVQSAMPSAGFTHAFCLVGELNFSLLSYFLVTCSSHLSSQPLSPHYKSMLNSETEDLPVHVRLSDQEKENYIIICTSAFVLVPTC